MFDNPSRESIIPEKENPMDALESLLTRRSIRKFQDRPVSHETIEDVLRAAMAAPSAGNQQPWRFVVITDRGVLDEHPVCKGAPCAILVCGDTNLEKYKGYWVIDCTLATANILAAAHSMGLGSVFLGIYPHEEAMNGLRQLLGLGENLIPLTLLPLGYPAEEKPASERYDPARITWK